MKQEEKIYSIYHAVNKVNGKSYVGFTSNFKRRKLRHLRDSLSDESVTPFYRAARKYGWDSFEWSILYQSKDREFTLNEMEPYFIQEKQSHITKNGYNATLGGEGASGINRKGLGYRAVTTTDNSLDWVLISDERLLNGILEPVSLTTIINEDGSTSTITSEYYHANRNDLTHVNKGKATVKDKNGEIFQIKTDDPFYISGNFVHISKDTVPVKNKTGVKTRVTKDDERYLSGDFIHTSKNTMWWNNGIESIMREEWPGDGWIRGSMGTTNTGQTWWNNGTECRMEHDCPGDGWVSGRLGNFKSTTGGKTCYNNGERNMFSFEHPGDGWIKGMIKKKS